MVPKAGSKSQRATSEQLHVASEQPCAPSEQRRAVSEQLPAATNPQAAFNQAAIANEAQRQALPSAIVRPQP